MHCTRELKAQPISAFCKSIGWQDFTTVIGYRFDEPKRVNLITAKNKKQWYPLYEWRIVKSFVRNFFLDQPFDLQLAEHDGNCELCHKKSKRKLLTQIVQGCCTNWHKKIEELYSLVNTKPNEPRKFFRGNETIEDLIEESKLPFDIYTDKPIDKQIYIDFDLDEQESCEESCEPFAD